MVNFYERRARRILPAFFLVMLVCTPLAWLWLLPQDTLTFAKSQIAASIFLANAFFARKNDYFDTASELEPLRHTWSLSLEEQYYFIFPILLLFSWKLGKVWTILILASISTASIYLAEWGATTHPAYTFYMLPTRAWELLIGALVAFHYTRKTIIRYQFWLHELGSIIGLTLIIYSIWNLTENTRFPGLNALAPTLGAALIILFATPKTKVGYLLSTSPFQWMGLISYSAYLWHQPLFTFARHRVSETPSQLMMALLTMITLPLAFLSWKYVEKPFRSRQFVPRRQVFILSFAGILLLSIIGLIGKNTNGLEFRLPVEYKYSNVFGVENAFNVARESDGSCPRLLGIRQLPEEVCLTDSNEPSILFIGDSHAMALYSSIYAKMFITPAMIISAHACPMYPNLRYETFVRRGWGNKCTEVSNEVIQQSEYIKSVETVIISNHFGIGLNEPLENKLGYSFNKKKVSNQDAFQIGHSSLISQLISLGKKVIFVVDIPQMTSNRKECFQKVLLGPSIDCRISRKNHDSSRASYMDQVKKLKLNFPDVVIYDPTTLFCDTNYCEIADGNKSFYFDNHHLSVFGSMRVLVDMSINNLIPKPSEK